MPTAFAAPLAISRYGLLRNATSTILTRLSRSSATRPASPAPFISSRPFVSANTTSSSAQHTQASTSSAPPTSSSVQPKLHSNSNDSAPSHRPFSSATEMRTHNCGELNETHVGLPVKLCGWAHAVRDKGSVLFLLIRDRHGIVQVTAAEEADQRIVQIAKSVRLEYTVCVSGTVSLRDASAVNKSMETGKIEVMISDLEILSKTPSLPFMISEPEADSSANEDTRLKHRYLDLRRPALQNNFVVRHMVTLAVRNYLNESGFLEMETPVLTKATPEGARDYLVPSRVHHGSWYALPQSPQIYKQLLMVSGMDRYFQIARCFRDEDLRIDRQPEFTQVDLEMSFVGRQSIMSIAQGILFSMFNAVFSEQETNKLLSDIPVLSYHEAMRRFGVDAPDMRFEMELCDVTNHPLILSSSFAPVESARSLPGNSGLVKAIVVPGAAKGTSRKVLDGYTAFVKDYRLSGLLYGKVQDDYSVSGPLSKLGEVADIIAMVKGNDAINAKPGDLILMACGPGGKVNAGLGRLRVKVGQERGMIEASDKKFTFCWVVDFPLFEYDSEAERYTSVHHPFTAPIPEHIPLLKSASESDGQLDGILSNSYDLVCNGSEIGGGSVRIHQPEVQQQVFKALGIGPEEQAEKFGFLMDALTYGAPPHAGMAFGLDRCIMVLTNAQSIRDVVAFPKTTSASDLMAGAPTPVPQSLLDELAVQSTAEEDQETPDS